MKNIKDITLSIFAIIGFVFILSSFNIQAETQETNSTVPESHEWQIYLRDGTTGWLLNKKTGEVKGLQAQGEYIFIPKERIKKK